jgi:C1A family cysteine protease
MSKHVYNLRRDTPDPRDYLFAPAPVVYPDEWDNRPLCTAVNDQGDRGSCTAQAATGTAEFLLQKQTGREVDTSPLFLYSCELQADGSFPQDAGSTIRQSVKQLAKCGVCLEATWPYSERLCKTPSAEAYVEALTMQATEYARVTQSEGSIKRTLAAGFCINVGIQIYESFESDEVSKTGIVTMPESGEQLLGGHALLIVGYKDNYYIIRNSWGDSWGDKGYCYIPEAYIHNSSLTSDLWVVKGMETGQ